MKKGRKKRFSITQMSFRNRISIWTLLIGAGAAFFLTIAFSILYYRTLQKNYHSEIQSHLWDIDTVFNSYVQNTAALTSSLYGSADGTMARLEDDYDLAEHLSYLNYIRNLITAYGYIHSVYFINQEGEISLWTRGVGSYTKDMDGKLLNAQIYVREESPFVWKLPYRYDENEIPILSFYFHEAPVDTEYYTGTVIVNVELAELCKRILNERDSSRELFVVNKDGIVILHSNPAYIGEDWSDKLFVQETVRGVPLFDLWEEGEHFEFICEPSKLEGFYLVAQSDYTGVSIFTGAFLVVPMICLLLILLIAVLSSIMGRHLAQPIVRTVEEIRQSGMEEKLDFISKDEKDELRFLQKYTTYVNQYMEDALENDQKNRVIYNLLRNDKNVDIQPYLLQEGILHADSLYVVITVEFVCRYEVADMEEMNSIRRSIVREYERILGNWGHCTCYEHGLRYLLFLVSEEKGKPIQIELLCEKLQEGCRFLMEENLSTDIYVAVSRCLESRTSCKAEVRRNNERMEARAVYGKYGVELVRENSERDRPSEKTIDRCVQALKDNDQSSYMGAINRMIEETEQVSWSQFVNWVVDVTEKIREVKAVMHRNYVKPDRNKVYAQVQQIHNLDSLQQWFEVLYDDVNEKMDQIRNTSTVSMMEDAIAYILENFGDHQLGAASLAAEFHISAKYFGQLFMEFSGKSVSDYIIQIRMEKARDFLFTRPDMEIMEVARKVGYRSASYFSTAFRKYYGVTPSQLRSNLNIQGHKKE